MTPRPDHGEKSYKGRSLKGKRAVITGGDSGIGRAVAIAYAREGADILISYLKEDEDAKEPHAGGGRPDARRSLLRGTSRIQNTVARSSQGGIRIWRHRHPCQQCRASGDLQDDRGHLRRGVGPDISRSTFTPCSI